MLVIENGCDQTTVNIHAFLVESFAGVQFNVEGALNSMTSTKLKLVNDDYTRVTLPNNVKVTFKINQAIWDQDPDQKDALLQPH